jgi:hypothetical protein
MSERMGGIKMLNVWRTGSEWIWIFFGSWSEKMAGRNE